MHRLQPLHPLLVLPAWQNPKCVSNVLKSSQDNLCIREDSYKSSSNIWCSCVSSCMVSICTSSTRRGNVPSACIMAKISSSLELRPSYSKNAATMCSVGLSSSYCLISLQCPSSQVQINHQPARGSILSACAHILCVSRRARLPACERCISQRYSLSGGTRLDRVNQWRSGQAKQADFGRGQQIHL